jgi:hypothetical protein
MSKRRREQLRVAQQTYRQRKETTIANLQTRVQELESGVEELCRSFLSFSTLLFDANVLEKQPHVTSAFYKVTQQCVSLARRGCDEPDQADLADAVVKFRKLDVTQIINLDYNPIVARHDALPAVDKTTQPLLTTADRCPVAQSPPTPSHQEQEILPFGIVLSSPTIPFSSARRPSLTRLSTTVSASSLMKQERWILSHRLVRECWDNGYRLLINSSGNDPKIPAIFGKQLNASERKHMIRGFYAALHGEFGDIIELGTKAVSPLRPMKNIYWPEQLAISSPSSPSLQISFEPGSDEWFDASDVQAFLLQKGIQIPDTSSPDSSPRFTSSSQFNVITFIRRGFSKKLFACQLLT